MNRFFQPYAIVLALFLIEEARAQVFLPPAVPVLIPNGIGFRYRSGNLAVGGFLNTGTSVGYVVPGYPAVPYPGFPLPGPPIRGPIPVLVAPPVYSILPTYGVMNSQVTVQVIQPTVVLSPSSAPRPDVAGVDLDVVRPPWAPDRPEPPRAPEKKFVPKEPEARPIPPPAVEIKKPAAPNEAQLLQAGIRAFRDQEIGLAAQRFRQASLAFPESPRPYFFLAQSFLALGKYNEAYDQIVLGLKVKPDWPKEKFNPRLELYGIEVDLYQEHIQALAESAKANHGKSLFLLGYIRWFEQKKPEALDWFRRAKPLLPDPISVNRFLDADLLVVRR